MKKIEEKIRKSIGSKMRELGSRSFYIRVTGMEDGTLKVKVFLEKGALELLVARKDLLSGIMEIFRGLEKELKTKILEEFKAL